MSSALQQVAMKTLQRRALALNRDAAHAEGQLLARRALRHGHALASAVAAAPEVDGSAGEGDAGPAPVVNANGRIAAL